MPWHKAPALPNFVRDAKEWEVADFERVSAIQSIVLYQACRIFLRQAIRHRAGFGTDWARDRNLPSCNEHNFQQKVDI